MTQTIDIFQRTQWYNIFSNPQQRVAEWTKNSSFGLKKIKDASVGTIISSLNPEKNLKRLFWHPLFHLGTASKTQPLIPRQFLLIYNNAVLLTTTCSRRISDWLSHPIDRRRKKFRLFFSSFFRIVKTVIFSFTPLYKNILSFCLLSSRSLSSPYAQIPSLLLISLIYTVILRRCWLITKMWFQKKNDPTLTFSDSWKCNIFFFQSYYFVQ